MIIAASTSVYHDWNKLIFSTEIDRYILSIVPTPGWAPRPPHRHLTVTDAHRRNLTNTGTSLRWPTGLQLLWVPQLAPKTRRGHLTLVMRLLKFTHTAAALCNRPVWLWPHHLFIFTLMWKRIRYWWGFEAVSLVVWRRKRSPEVYCRVVYLVMLVGDCHSAGGSVIVSIYL